MNPSLILAAAKECFEGGKKEVQVAIFTKALQKRHVETRKKLVKIASSTDYLKLNNARSLVLLTRDIFAAKVKQMPTPPTSPPQNHAARVVTQIAPTPPQNHAVRTVGQDAQKPPSAQAPTGGVKTTAKEVLPVSFDCDTLAISQLLEEIELDDLDLFDNRLTDIFIDAGSKASAKIDGKCVLYDKVVEMDDIDSIMQRLPGDGLHDPSNNRLIFGRTLHRLSYVRYNDSVTGITIRIGRKVSGLLPIFEGIVEGKNVLLCGAPNVGKTSTLREMCKYLSRDRCLCLIDTSSEVCGTALHKDVIVGTSRVFRPANPESQYKTLLDCVRNHSPDVIAIDELNTREEMSVCQTIALRSIQMVASLHGNIEDVVFNPMLNKALGGSTQALVSDRNAVDGRKVVEQRTSRPIFDVVINIKRQDHGLEYIIVEDVADNVTRIMQGKPVRIRKRHLDDDIMVETEQEHLFPRE